MLHKNWNYIGKIHISRFYSHLRQEDYFGTLIPAFQSLKNILLLLWDKYIQKLTLIKYILYDQSLKIFKPKLDHMFKISINHFKVHGALMSSTIPHCQLYTCLMPEFVLKKNIGSQVITSWILVPVTIMLASSA